MVFKVTFILILLLYHFFESNILGNAIKSTACYVSSRCFS